jgi:hypothetical protein
MEITQNYLKEHFDYKDGHLIVKKTGNIKTETPINKAHRYHRTVIKNKVYVIHRLIFLFHYGYLPKIIDHIDNDSTNNKIENLREATQQQNCINRKLHKTNKSGCKNVFWHNSMKKWSVSFSVNAKRKNFGFFDDLELADLVAIEARNLYHGPYACHF